jgi:hypothetical protein
VLAPNSNAAPSALATPLSRLDFTGLFLPWLKKAHVHPHYKCRRIPANHSRRA